METYGAISLIPCAVVIISAIITKRTLEPLIVGSIVGFIIASPKTWLADWLDGLYGVIGDGTTIWLYCVCLPFGGLVALIEISKGTIGFSEWAAKFANSGKKSLIISWLLGIFLFADDYFNALAVGTSMRRLTDKHRVPREMLAYVTNSTGAVVCLVIPFSTWSAFMITQMEGAGAAAKGAGQAMYFQSIPYMFYCLATILVVPLVIVGVLPKLGGMKAAWKRALETGQTIPDSKLEEVKQKEALDAGVVSEDKKPKVINFALPMLVLAAVTLTTSDMQKGVLAAIVVCLVLYIPQKLMPLAKLFDRFFQGFFDMLIPVMIVTFAFTLQVANDKLGMATYVIDNAAKIMTPELMPLVSFIVVAALGFATGCFWGSAAICFPIIVPLAAAVDSNMILVCGAIMSGSGWGSTACFFSDAPTLTCTSTQISNADYAKSVLPMLITPTIIACVLYVIFGFTMN